MFKICFAFAFFLFNFSSARAARLQEDDFYLDLHFIRETLIADHPGVHNELDPDFLNRLENNVQKAEQELFQADSDEEKAKILEEFGDRFEDAHLWVYYPAETKNGVTVPQQPKLFQLQELVQGTYWVRIPTFRPSGKQIHDLNDIIERLPQFREQNVVFDLRGNGGGNSFWGQELLRALFGAEYADQQMIKSQLHVYADWRASKGNIDYVESLISLIQEQFGENHSAIQWIEKVYAGIKQAYASEETYYSDPMEAVLPIEPAQNLFCGRAFAIIDRDCGSACLSFIDGLKAMHANVVFIGETTGADTLYMELRRVALPSGKGTFGFPMKVYRNRLRGNNVPHIPDISFSDLQDTGALQDFVFRLIQLDKREPL